MIKEYMENARKNGSAICEHTNRILSSLCETIFLITGKECDFDFLYDGSVIVTREDEENQRYKNATEAIRCLANIIDTLYK